MPEAEELLSRASRIMTQAYGELLRKAQLAGVTMYREQLQQASRLWIECEAEWGCGHGHRDRVAGRNRDWFKEQPSIDFEADLLTVLAREWASFPLRVESIFETT